MKEIYVEIGLAAIIAVPVGLFILWLNN